MIWNSGNQERKGFPLGPRGSESYVVPLSGAESLGACHSRFTVRQSARFSDAGSHFACGRLDLGRRAKKSMKLRGRDLWPESSAGTASAKWRNEMKTGAFPARAENCFPYPPARQLTAHPALPRPSTRSSHAWICHYLPDRRADRRRPRFRRHRRCFGSNRPDPLLRLHRAVRAHADFRSSRPQAAGLNAANAHLLPKFRNFRQVGWLRFGGFPADRAAVLPEKILKAFSPSFP